MPKHTLNSERDDAARCAEGQPAGHLTGFVLPGMRQRSIRTGALPRRVRTRVYLPIFFAFVTRISIVAFGRYVRRSERRLISLAATALRLNAQPFPLQRIRMRVPRGRPDRDARERGARALEAARDADHGERLDERERRAWRRRRTRRRSGCPS